MKLSINWYVINGFDIKDWNTESPTLTFIDEKWISRGISSGGRFYSFDESAFKFKDRFEFL